MYDSKNTILICLLKIILHLNSRKKDKNTYLQGKKLLLIHFFTAFP